MGRRDVKSDVTLTVLHAKAQQTATQSIQSKNVTESHGACFVVDVGAHTADDLTVTFQHRDGSDSYVDIPAADLDGNNDIAITASEENSQIYVGYTGNKEDIGAVITDGGTGDAVVGVYTVEAYPTQFPVN